MFDSMWRIVLGIVEITEDEANKLYAALVTVLVGCIVFVLVMWGVNVWGTEEWNYIFFFFGGFLILVKGFQPRIIVASAGAGVAVQALRDEDMSHGAIKGVQVLYKVVTGILLGFWIAAGILSTWSFKVAPLAFLPIIAMVMVLTVMSAFFELKGKKVPIAVITAYAIVIIATAAWKTVPEDLKYRSPATGASSPAKAVPAGPVVTQAVAKWEKVADDGPLPVGVWSEPVELFERCGITFGGGYGAVYIAQYQYYSDEWKDLVMGEHKPGNKFRFKMLKTGQKTQPYTIECKPRPY